MKSGIYIITCKVNGMSYIGRSVNVADRFKQHRCDAKTRPGSSALHQAMALFGLENFTFDVLEVAIPSTLRDLEGKYIAEMNTKWPNGYNLGGTGGGSREGALKREARLRERRLLDPQFDAQYRAQKSSATKQRSEGYQYKGAETFRKKFNSDPEYRAMVSANRRIAGIVSHTKGARDAQIS